MNIYPSLISSNLLELKTVLTACSPYCDGFHIDIMDNHFVPNLTWGFSFAEAFSNATPLPLHFHCMVDDPLVYAQKINLRANDCFIFHYEATRSQSDIEKICSVVKNKHAKVGIALNPSTAIDVLFSCVHLLDQVLIMSVNPGFSGQECIESTFKKIDALTHLKHERGGMFSIALDGGIKEKHLMFLKDKKVDDVVMASAIFSAPSPIETLAKFYSAAKKG